VKRRRTNRWTGATGSEFRIKRDPAKLLGGAVARSTQTFDRFALSERKKAERDACFAMHPRGGSVGWSSVGAALSISDKQKWQFELPAWVVRSVRQQTPTKQKHTKENH